jgi:hypothetical protein
MKQHYFECDCHTPEHVIRFSYDDEDGDLYTEVFLSHKVWYKRIWTAIKYVFGYKCKYGHFDCTLIRKEDYDRLVDLILTAKNFKEEK